jgi:hypothetical protein
MGKRTMKVVKFVTEDFKSPGNYEQLDYSNFGIPIEIDADPKEKEQCAKGIHVILISEDADLKNVFFTGTMILLEIEEEDIIYCEDNGKMRVSKVIPVRQVNKSDKEWEIIGKAACKDPEYAYWYAIDVDQKSTGETRTAVCTNPYYAYWYAINVDQKPTEETRTAACQDPGYAYKYAKNVDKKPTDETRKAACQDSYHAYWYAIDVDKKPTKETRAAACQDPLCTYMYTRDVDQKPTVVKNDMKNGKMN